MRRRPTVLAPIAALGLAGLLAARLAGGAELRVAAAASLGESLPEIAVACATPTGATIVPSFGASSTLARQIVEGAPLDVLLSADEETIDGLERRGLVAPASRVSFASNRLVVVVARDRGTAVAAADDLLSSTVRTIAVAEPHSVPAGVYARRWLERRGLWDRLQAKLVPTDNVRAALSTVASGNADVAIVYRTDARISPRVRVAFEVPEGETPPISYGAAALLASPQPQAARRFLACLTGAEGQAVLARHGFLPPLRPGSAP